MLLLPSCIDLKVEAMVVANVLVCSGSCGPWIGGRGNKKALKMIKGNILGRPERQLMR
jgi:hypothetical protein